MSHKAVFGSAPSRGCPVVLAAIASFAVAYGFEAHPLMQIGSTLPLSDMAAGLAQAFNQLGSLNLASLSRTPAETTTAT